MQKYRIDGNKKDNRNMKNLIYLYKIKFIIDSLEKLNKKYYLFR